MQNILQEWFQETNSHFWDEKSKRRDYEELGNGFKRLPHQLWSVDKFGLCADAAITGIMPPPLMEIQVITWVSYTDELIGIFLSSHSHWLSLCLRIGSKISSLLVALNVVL
jgi:hypothetical protein